VDFKSSSYFTAKCPFEIENQIFHEGVSRTITDIVCAHYIRDGKIEFGYELDNNKEYVGLAIRV